jgi:DNA polymerase III subunit delta
MKPTAAQVHSFLQKPEAKVRVVLFYGPDAGLVRERADGLARKIVKDLDDPFCVARFSGGVLSDDPARLFDEAAALPLGGGRRLVWIQHAAESLASALGAFLKDIPAGDSLILIEAGGFEKRSKLRALCEGDGLAIAIPCYLEDNVQRQRTIAALLEGERLKAGREVLAFLAETLPPDRLALRSEIEKLALYARGQKFVTLEDARAALGDSGAAETDDLVHAVALGDMRRVAVLFDHLLAEQVSVVAILRATQRHFLRLQLARATVDGGVGAKAAIERLQPKVFWKYVEPMARQVGKWDAASIEAFLKKLYEAEASVKQTGVPDSALCSQVLLVAVERG